MRKTLCSFGGVRFLTLLISVFVFDHQSAGAAAVKYSRSVCVRVPAKANGRLARLPFRPRVSIDYGSFRFLELGAGDLAALQASGIPFELDETGPVIRVAGREFDPLADGEPPIPASLRGDGTAPGFRILQLAGPVKDEWLTRLKADGIDVLQYYPYQSYLIWASAAKMNRLSLLDFVRWSGLFHPAYKTSANLSKQLASGFSGRIENLAITFYDDGQVEGTLGLIKGLGGHILNYHNAQPDGRFKTAIVKLDAAAIEGVSLIPTVWAVEFSSPRPGFDDELATQNAAGQITSGIPTTGFFTWLAAKGVDGTGVSWADVDTGLNSSHPDITGRSAVYVSYPGAGAANTDLHGHGSHTAGAIFGDPRTTSGGTGILDGAGFYWGAGVAPKSSLVIQNALLSTTWPPAGGWQTLSKDSVTNGASGSSNSWYTGASGAQGYSAAARTHDLMVRDANFDTTTIAEPIIMVFSAGNAGSGASTMTEPKEAKNLITVGATRNFNRIGSSVNDMASYSSRGPALDGRTLPSVTTPGENTVSFNGTESNTCGTVVAAPGGTYYNTCSGTSMACPIVAGSSALIVDWWRQEGRGTPSPAMVKALLINGATDMNGGSGAGGNIPNNSQGWGRVNLDNVIRTGLSTIYHDQDFVLGAAGEAKAYTLSVANISKPVKVSLVWTDAPGAVAASPALVNDLDLTVSYGGNTYRGNVFNGGFSVQGGSVDRLNNIENVYLPAGSTGTFVVTVYAHNIAGDGVPYNADTTDQDFAIVISNGTLTLAPAIARETATLLAENCSPANGAPDPGEGVTYSFQVKNVGSLATTNLIATLATTGGVTNPSAPQTIGVLPVDSTWTGSFSFRVDPATLCGATITATLTMLDSTTNLGSVSWQFTTGVAQSTTGLSENFDGITAPTLPSGWTTSASGTLPRPWITRSDTSVSAPNSAAVGSPYPTNTSDDTLDSPPFAVPVNGATLSFRHRFQFEGSFDGGRLEIKIGAGTFQEFVTAGGTFVSGGYNSTLSTNYSNPIGGSRAWSGTSSSFTPVIANLPPSAAGQNVQLRWRAGYDTSAGSGDPSWAIDDIAVSNNTFVCSTTCNPGVPFITPATAIARIQGGNHTNPVTIATVIDDSTPPVTSAGDLIVTAMSVPSGLTVTGITNTAGTVTANITASCTAALGANIVVLKVEDTDAPPKSSTANLTVNVTPNTPPTLGTYGQTVVLPGESTTITPSTPPADDGTVSSVTVSTPTGFTGTIVVDPVTGVVTITDANPHGDYTVTVTATDNCGESSTSTFNLMVGLAFYTLQPCRVIDTRGGAPIGGPVIPAGPGAKVVYTVAGTCGIPITAKALYGNLTVTQATAAGSISVYRGDEMSTTTEAVHFTIVRSRANNATIALAINGSGSFIVENNSAGTLHFIFDVNGYFQ